jgi:hypothetical protein
MPAFLRHYDEVEQSNRRFEPFVREILKRCAREEIGMNRYAPLA